MEILIFFVAVVSVINLVILIALAGAVSKLIATNEELPVINQTEKLLDLPSVGPMTYDLSVFNGKTEPFTDGMERRLMPTKNWDGISQE